MSHKTVVMITDLAMVAMDQKRMIRLIESDLHYRMHGVLRNLEFLRALHINDNMTNAVVPHESIEIWRKICVHKRSGIISAVVAVTRIEESYSTVFKPNVPRKWKSSTFGKLLRYIASGRTMPKLIGLPSPLDLSAFEGSMFLATSEVSVRFVTIV